MPERSALIRKIDSHFSALSAEVELEVRSNLTDTMRRSEDICGGLLNRIYGYHLVNTDQVSSKYPGVDLVDPDQNVAVQVTFSLTQRKIHRTIEVFQKSELSAQYQTLIFFMVARRPKPALVRNHTPFELTVMDFDDLLRELSSLDMEQLWLIEEYLDAELGTLPGEEISPDYSNTMLPESVRTCAAGDTYADMTLILGNAIAELPAESRQVLSFAMLLPERGLREALFRDALTTLQKRGLAYLSRNGWVLDVGEYLSIHPYVRKVCLRTLHPAPEDYGEFLDRLWYFEQRFRWDWIPLLERRAVKQCLAQIYVNAASVTGDPRGIYAQRSAELWRSANQISQALRWELKLLESYEASAEPDPWARARACHFTGECYSLLGDHEPALQYWEETLRLCTQKLTVQKADLAAAHYHVGCAHIALEHYPEAARALELARNLQREHLALDHPFREEVQKKIDTAYAALGQLGTSLQYLRDDLNRETEARYLWMPVPAGVGLPSFFGREEELRQILARLHRGEKPIFISGLRGSGKTELVKHFARNYRLGQVYFTHFDTSFTQIVAGMVRNIRPALPQNTMEQPVEVRCSMVMEVLKNCSANDILIIDDVSSDAVSLQDPICRELLALDCRLIFVTDGSPDGSICVQPLPYEELIQIFREHGAELDRSRMYALIDAVNGHAMTIDLIARALGRGGAGAVTADQLLDAFSHGLSDGGLGQAVEPGPYGQQVTERLGTILRLAHFSPAARDVLRYAVLLPDHGIHTDLFWTALPWDCQDALHDLISQGWISVEDGIMTFPAAIRAVCRSELNPSEESCAAFLDALWNQYSPMRIDTDKYRQMAEVFSLAAQTLEDRSAQYILRADTLWRAVGDYRKSREMLDDALPRYEHMLPPDSPELAQLYNNAGRTYSQLGMLANALDYTLRAIKICEKIYPADHPELAASYRNAGDTYAAMGNHAIALEYLQKSLDILEKALPSDHPDLADICDSLGGVYGIAGDQKKALEYQMQALELRKKLYPEWHAHLAVSCSNIGSTYALLGDHPRALEYRLKANEIYMRVLPSDDPTLAASYLNLSDSYSDLGQYASALEYREKALYIYRATLPTGHPMLVTIRNGITLLREKTGSMLPT